MTIEEAIAIAKAVEGTDASSVILTEIQEKFPDFEWESLARAYRVTKKVLYRSGGYGFKKVEKRTKKEHIIHKALLQMEDVIDDARVYVVVRKYRNPKSHDGYSEYELREEKEWVV